MDNTQPKKNKFKEIWLPVFVSCLILTPIGNAIYDHTKNIFIVTPILKALSFIWNNILNFKIPFWIILAIALTIHYIRKIVKLTATTYIYDERPEPDYLNWKQAKFKKWTWVWKWKWVTSANQNNGYYEVGDLAPLCKCKYEMYSIPGYAAYRCPKCDNEYADYIENPSDIEKIIKYKIERREYPH